MPYEEFKIRSFLKKLTNEELYDSEYLLGINFDKAPIESIIGSLVSLYDNVSILKSRIESDLKHLSPLAIDDFYRKRNVLVKLMDDNRIYASIMRYKIAARNKESKPMVCELVQK